MVAGHTWNGKMKPNPASLKEKDMQVQEISICTNKTPLIYIA